MKKNRPLSRRPSPSPMALVNTLNEHGNALLAAGQPNEAIACYRQALALAPKLAPLHFNLGKALKDAGQFDEAEAAFRQALALDAQDADIPYMLGNLLREQGRYAEALEYYQQAATLAPHDERVLSNLAMLWREEGRAHEAVAWFERLVAAQPENAHARLELGLALSKDRGRYFEARAQLLQAQALLPDNPITLDALGQVHCTLGDFDAGLACHRQAVALTQDAQQRRVAYGNLLFSLNYHPSLPAEEIFAEYRRFGAALAPLQRWHAWPNERAAERRLRIGYVSPDFRKHSTRFFLEPLLANHDHAAFEIYAYGEVAKEDEVTARYRGYVDRYQCTVGLSDEALAERIHADGIDLLIDLAGATAGHRLGVFARKPAPVSLTYLGFGYTTGLSSIDYFLGDEIMAPPGCEALFAEQVYRLPAPCFVFRPEPGMQRYEGLPAQDNGYLTFATLSRAVRLNERVIKTWAAILHRVPGARLLIDAMDFYDPKTAEFMRARFTAQGIAPERLIIGCHSPPWELLRLMVDIGLDCFPHNSGTTLFEMAYLGIPFITLADRPSVGRIGSTIAHGLGHPEWIAQSEPEYIDKAVALASDLERLARLRAGLRSEMEHSPLMDEVGFTRKVEAAYRAMWRRWCAAA